jgi:carboxyl-terminal processing protease
MKKLLFVLAGLGLLFWSCKKNIPGTAPWTAYSDSSFGQVFEGFWTGMNTNYVWWSIDTVNWDAEYTFYKPLFAGLNVHDSADQQTSKGYFTAMTAGLKDSHYYILFSDNSLKGVRVSPADNRKKLENIDSSISATYFYNRVYYLLDSATRVRNFLNFKNSTEEPGDTLSQRLYMVTGTIDQSYIYFYLNVFYMYANRDSAQVQSVLLPFISLLQNADSYKGLIIDLRSNGGGSLNDLNYVWGNLIDQAYTFGYTRQKSGPNRLDYSPWTAAVFAPSGFGLPAFSKPIVILTDQNTISMAEQSTMAIRKLRNTYVIGDTTWGATGPLYQSGIQYFNGGEFFFSDSFGFVYTSAVQFKYYDGTVYEGKGFPPDEYVHTNLDSLRAGDDLQINAAKVFLSNQ